MAEINLSGSSTNFVRVCVADDVYEAVLGGVEPKTFDVTGKFGVKKRLILKWRLPDGKEVPQFVSNAVRKGSGTYQNSGTYTLLEKAGLLSEFVGFVGSRQSITDEELISFLGKLVGRKGKVNVQARTPVDGGPAYSVVKEIVRFI